MSFAGTTHIGVVLDRSGSMIKARKATITGFNTWKKTTLEVKGTYRTTIVLFNDTTFEYPLEKRIPRSINPRPMCATEPPDNVGLDLRSENKIRPLRHTVRIPVSRMKMYPGF